MPPKNEPTLRARSETPGRPGNGTPGHARNEPLRVAGIVATGAVALAAVMMAAAAIGPEPIPLGEVLRIVIHRPAAGEPGPWTAQHAAIVLQVRLPRIVVGALVGGALAFAGTLMQGLFRNPLASPGLLGVSGGGALGAVLCIATGAAARTVWAVPAAAFAGAFAAVGIVYALASRHGETPMATLLLAGIAMTAFTGAAVSLVLVFSARYSWDISREILFWTLGGLDARRWEHAGVAAVPVTAAVIGGIFFLRELNVMLLGEEQARTLGVATQRVKIWVLLLTSAATGAAVAVSGLIGFVGLVIPHLMRLMVGPDHRALTPAALFGGAAFVVIMDTLARTIAPTELRLGILTGALGAPFFLFLLVRYRDRAVRL